jgi:hypothetical protein
MAKEQGARGSGQGRAQGAAGGSSTPSRRGDPSKGGKASAAIQKRDAQGHFAGKADRDDRT